MPTNEDTSEILSLVLKKLTVAIYNGFLCCRVDSTKLGADYAQIKFSFGKQRYKVVVTPIVEGNDVP